MLINKNSYKKYWLYIRGDIQKEVSVKYMPTNETKEIEKPLYPLRCYVMSLCIGHYSKRSFNVHFKNTLKTYDLINVYLKFHLETLSQ